MEKETAIFSRVGLLMPRSRGEREQPARLWLENTYLRYFLLLLFRLSILFQHPSIVLFRNQWTMADILSLRLSEGNSEERTSEPRRSKAKEGNRWPMALVCGISSVLWADGWQEPWSDVVVVVVATGLWRHTMWCDRYLRAREREREWRQRVPLKPILVARCLAPFAFCLESPRRLFSSCQLSCLSVHYLSKNTEPKER